MTKANPYRELPSVDRLLANERVRGLGNGSSEVVTGIVRTAIDAARASVAGGRAAPSEEQIVDNVLGLAEVVFRPSLRPVINATGVIIHTNLGRAPLSEEAIEAMAAISRGYSNLEFDLEAGTRGSRASHLEEILRQVTGAEAGDRGQQQCLRAAAGAFRALPRTRSNSLPRPGGRDRRRVPNT